MQADIFEVLKTTLKARRITYADLAARLALSEPTVKRIFAERDCKLSRMVQICEALGLSLDDVIAQAGRIDVRPISLGDRVEAQLAEDRPAFHLFILLRDGMTAAAVQRHFGLEDAALFALGRRLEKLGLVEVMPGGRIRLLEKRPVRFRRDGPLHQALMRLNMAFLRDVFLRRDTEDAAFLTLSRRISEATARHVMARLQEVRRELSDLARKDQLTLPDAALHSYKLSIAWAPVAFADLLDLGDAPASGDSPGAAAYSSSATRR